MGAIVAKLCPEIKESTKSLHTKNIHYDPLPDVITEMQKVDNISDLGHYQVDKKQQLRTITYDPSRRSFILKKKAPAGLRRISSEEILHGLDDAHEWMAVDLDKLREHGHYTRPPNLRNVEVSAYRSNKISKISKDDKNISIELAELMSEPIATPKTRNRLFPDPESIEAKSVDLKEEEKEHINDLYPTKGQSQKAPERLNGSTSKPQLNLKNSDSESFHTCRGFDAMTIGSLLSSSGFGSKRSKKDMSLSKKNMFSEFLYEMESLITYFDFEENYPFEEIILDEQNLSESNGIKSILLTFCPEIRDDVFEGVGTYFKKRIIKSRCLILLKKSLKHTKEALCAGFTSDRLSRQTALHLKGKADFDDKLDSFIIYSYKFDDEEPQSFKTIRIASQKTFHNGKTAALVYERSQDIQNFYWDSRKRLLNIKNEGQDKEKAYLLKSLSKIEKASENFTKVYMYTEVYWPESMSLKKLRAMTISLMTAGFTNN